MIQTDMGDDPPVNMGDDTKRSTIFGSFSWETVGFYGSKGCTFKKLWQAGCLKSNGDCMDDLSADDIMHGWYIYIYIYMCVYNDSNDDKTDKIIDNIYIMITTIYNNNIQQS